MVLNFIGSTILKIDVGYASENLKCTKTVNTMAFYQIYSSGPAVEDLFSLLPVQIPRARTLPKNKASLSHWRQFIFQLLLFKAQQVQPKNSIRLVMKRNLLVHYEQKTNLKFCGAESTI